ncbi:MAG: MoaD/ThiS family protein [Planctomycetaceae bacterium]|nr:MoaD/ThiS family protein [Planctomycetaceae bacterium]MCA9065348.1 MoaD/ThiS family protein [Planctomycetaceae bacterium]
MRITLQIPRILQRYHRAGEDLAFDAADVHLLLQQLKQSNPAVYQCLCDETGQVRRHIHLFVNDTFVDPQRGLQVPLCDGDIVSVFQAVSGG